MVRNSSQSRCRPLTGEPLALDLVNTEWIDAGRRCDLLAEDPGVDGWLRTNRIWITHADPERLRRNLIEARSALRLILEGDERHRGRRRINVILAGGRVAWQLGDAEPEVEFEVPGYLRPAWLAAYNYLELIRTWPRWRIKSCAHPDCILWFLDTSRNGSRKWCDMRTCGNRYNVQRHYERTHGGCDPGKPADSEGAGSS